MRDSYFVLAFVGVVGRLMATRLMTCAAGVPESVHVAVKLYEPASVGVPEMSPADESDSPGGSAPDVMVHE